MTRNPAPVERVEVSETGDRVFREQGMAIYIKGKMVVGIHPNNLQNNIDGLASDDLKFHWPTLLKNAETCQGVETRPDPQPSDDGGEPKSSQLLYVEHLISALRKVARDFKHHHDITAAFAWLADELEERK